MRTRIVAAEAKVGYFIVAGLLAVLVIGVTWATLGSLVGTLMVVPLQFLIVGFAVRNFRDAEIEAVHEPRPWSRMTARPPSGFALGALFLVQGLWSGLAGFQGPNGWALVLGSVTEVIIGVLFIRSSLKLRTESGVAVSVGA